MDGALLADQQTGAHLHAAGSQRKGCGQLTAIGDAACRDDRDIHRVHHLRHQCHGGHLAHMAAALGALGNDGIHAQRDEVLGQNGRCHHRDDLDAGFLPHGDVLAGVACAGGDDLDALLHDDLRKLVGLRMHQHDVDAERFIGERLAAADVLPQGLDVHAACADEAQRTGVGAGGGELAGGDVGHAALNDGVFRTQNFVQKFHLIHPL